MPVTIKKPSFNIREALNSLKYKIGAKGAELISAKTTEDVYGSINPVGFKNLIHNGDFQVWQRGTTGTGSSGYFYVADRWSGYSYGSNSCTISRQSFTPGQLAVPGAPVYYARMTDTASRCLYTHGVEDLRRFSDQTVTLSFWIKSNIPKNIVVGLHAYYGVSDSEGLLPATEWDTGVPMTTTWRKFTLTTKIKSFAGKTFDTNGGSLQILITHPSGNPSTVDLANVQLEFGTTATPFERRPYAAELALCQRYFQAIGGQVSYQRFGMGYLYSSTGGYFTVPYKVTMRAAPSLSYNGTFRISNGSGSNPAVTSLAVDQSGTDIMSILVAYSAASGYGAGLSASLEASNDSQAKLFFSAEY